ncbi:TrkA C-terminal domain-containing protein [Candidatus Sulfurimonas baltica]|uniref:TrkA family potassium uptake protein n=1 Tax=Candidatus Sulfurimonas baltica TaxID=2740404 RepID=A0A7S7RNT0_9BACT|nr:TrkA C-terminal domain-containing protein [Candidatus Sulfurimonas baltica]QOY52856.1 TrkA family potassium uptake protein [Candidatus Sulfurimonas baltica]
MRQKSALIFGYNDYTFEIEKNISAYYKNIYIFRLGEYSELKEQNNYKIHSFDLSDNWDDLSTIVDIDDCVAFCVLEDMAENIFLTISLRDSFKDLTIVALAEDKESTDKLTLAGATRVIPTTQTTANIIVEMLEKPIVTEVLHNILYEKSDLKIAQIVVDNNNFFDGKYPADIDWSREHGIIVISIVHDDMSSEFIYASKEKHHIIKSGDIFVVVGYEQDIKDFEKLIGSRL